MLIAANILGWIVAHKGLATATGLALLLFFVAGYVHFCTPSRLERKIESENPVVIESEQVANQAVETANRATQDAKNAQEAANKAQSNVNAVQRDKRSNVAIDEANRNRCLAFPQSEGCR